MKKIFLLLLSLCFLGISQSTAQSRLVYLDNQIKGGFYLGLGLHQPTGMAALPQTGGDFVFGSLIGEDGLGLKSGTFVELGGLLYFGKNFKRRKIRFGLNFDVKAAYVRSQVNSFSIDNKLFETEFAFEEPELSAGIGPLISFNPVGALVIDVHTKLRVDYSKAPSFSITDEYDDYFYLESEMDQYGEYYPNFNSSFGMRLKYGRFMLSAEWTSHLISDTYSDYNGYDFASLEIGALFTKQFTDLSIAYRF